jgi:hypothetical protein
MENEKAGKAGKVNQPIRPTSKIGGSMPSSGALTPDQQTIARGILANYDLRNLDSIQARKIADIFNTMGLGEAGLRWSLQNAGVDPIPFFNMVHMAQSTTNLYVMTDAVPHGINVREKATSESKLLYMLAKVDASHPVITITKFSDDKSWGFMETGDKEKNGWIYMEYVKHL